MKRLAVSLGMAALGAAVANAAPAYNLHSTSGKAWSVAASLRGFYDDNYTLLNTDEQESFGFVFSPSVGVNLSLDQTLITADYIYSLYWYEDRDDDEFDHTHQFALNILHSFSERLALELRDSFVVSQLPELIDDSGPTILTTRTEGDNIRNRASVRLNADLTRQLGVLVGYENIYYNYENEIYSDLLDRMEHVANVDLRWLVARNTTGVVGYQIRAVRYSEDDPIGGGYASDDRDSLSHFGYVGVDHAINKNLTGSLRGGAQFTEYEGSDFSSSCNPYFEGSLTYGYSPDGSVQFGVRHAINQTDRADAIDQESTVLFANLKHQITPKLFGTVFSSYQRSTFNSFDSASDGEVDTFYGVGLNLSYSFTQHFSADVGYNYDILCSDLSGRGYERNRIFLGFTAAY